MRHPGAAELDRAGGLALDDLMGQQQATASMVAALAGEDAVANLRLIDHVALAQTINAMPPEHRDPIVDVILRHQPHYTDCEILGVAIPGELRNRVAQATAAVKALAPLMTEALKAAPAVNVESAHVRSEVDRALEAAVGHNVAADTAAVDLVHELLGDGELHAAMADLSDLANPDTPELIEAETAHRV